MQYFFNDISPIGKSTIVPPNWRYVKDSLTSNVATVKSYYNSRVISVKNNHFLVRLLTALGVSFNHHVERYHQIVEAKALQYSMGFKMTSSVYKGALFKGIFFGENSVEILVATDELFNPYIAYDNWKTQKAVTCVYHNRSDLDLNLPNGKKTGTDEGISVFAINIPLLAVQFKAFIEETYKNFVLDNSNNILHPASHFIHMYVLPGMLDSLLDIALFNRAYNLAVGRPMSSSIKDHPFYLKDYTDMIDKIYLEQINYFKNSNKDFHSVLRTFQGYSGSFEKILELPRVASTRQVVWTEPLARIRAIEFMTKLTTNGGYTNNASDMISFVRTLRYYNNDQNLRQSIPADYREDLDISIINAFGREILN